MTIDQKINGKTVAEWDVSAETLRLSGRFYHAADIRALIVAIEARDKRIAELEEKFSRAQKRIGGYMNAYEETKP